MFPNPQASLPLPHSPSLEQYRKLAKDLVKACKSGQPAALRGWTERWITALRDSLRPEQRSERGVHRVVNEVNEFITAKLERGDRRCVLADAQLILARSHGFPSWMRFAQHLDKLTHAESSIAEFEAAADAIILGDEARLRGMLATNPALIHARSDREHGATLLHYTAANGVEGYRQVTPRNIVAIARILLDAGAEVDATCDVYRGDCTTLGLAMTSAHPRIAGNQLELMQLLIDRGADVEAPDMAGKAGGALHACLANGCPEAAAFMADKGARVSFAEAGAVGRIDRLRSFGDVPQKEVDEALHGAAFNGHADAVRWLLAHRKPDLESLNEYGGTPLTGTLWHTAHGLGPDAALPVLEALLAAGSKVPASHPPTTPPVDALLERHGSRVDHGRRWLGDEPE